LLRPEGQDRLNVFTQLVIHLLHDNVVKGELLLPDLHDAF